jgi:hypothetical protein
LPDEPLGFRGTIDVVIEGGFFIGIAGLVGVWHGGPSSDGIVNFDGTPSPGARQVVSRFGYPAGMQTPEWLPVDLAGAAALAGVDVTLPERQFEDAIRDAIIQRRRYLDGWDYSIKGWCVALPYPERERFYSMHLAIALGWCLVWMVGITGEIGTVIPVR